MKKFTAFIVAAALPICAFSCESKSAPESSSVAEAEVPVELMSFKSAKINMGDDFEEIICTEKRSVYQLIFGKMSSGDYCGYMTDSKFAEKRTFTFTPQENEKVRKAALTKMGKTAVLTTIERETMLYIFDSNGNIEKTYELGEIFDTDDRYSELLCTDDGFYINIARHTLGFVDAEGNYKGEVSTGTRTICAVVNDSNDEPCVLMSEGISTFLGKLSGGNITEETDCGELADYTNAVCTGKGDLTIAAVVGNGLYGLKENTWVKLSDFSDNDFSTFDIRDIDMIDEDEFAAAVLLGNKYELRMLTQRDISEIKQKKIIKMADLRINSNNDPYDELTKKYNSESDEYKVEMVVYTNEYIDDSYDDLKLDIISGNAPDIIKFGGDLTVKSFGDAESIFVDLYSLMDKDSDISREDFLDGFLAGFERNGKLLHISPTFMLRTLMVKDKFTNGLTSWDFDQFEEIYRSHSADMDITATEFMYTRYDMLNTLFDLNYFYDAEKGECYFDSPEFIRTIKFIKENNIGNSELDVMGKSIGVGDLILSFRNDHSLINNQYIRGFNDLREFISVYSGEPCTIMGFPNDDGTRSKVGLGGGYGIMANSQCIDGAWDFLKYYLFSEDSYERNWGEFQGIEKYYKDQLEYNSTLHTYTDPETGEEKNADFYGVSIPDINENFELELHPFTKEEAEKYDDFVRNALKNFTRGDGKIGDIIEEELISYFEGERSAEEAAEIIQNRSLIYLSEQS